MPPSVPPIKCQGIKTKLVPVIQAAVNAPPAGKWIEPFCGSCVVALNIQPQNALLTDTNEHIIRLYRAIQSGEITPASVRRHLAAEGAKLSLDGGKYYGEVRARFNASGDSLDFLFLNRSCFNGVMRFNKKGAFNVPFCHKPDRFAPAYITKIANQVKALGDVSRAKNWRFEVADFRTTLAQAVPSDFVYADPPYLGRHVDYYNHWNEKDERELIGLLKSLSCPFLLSTWHGKQYRLNPTIQEHWEDGDMYIRTMEHFYHVGSFEELRHAMTEAIISNFETAVLPVPTIRQTILNL